MTLRGATDSAASWRPARGLDLAAINRMAAAIHPDYPERPAVFADRLALHPSGMLLASIDAEPVGYAIGHPWRGPAPLLDRCIDALPEQPDSYWIHDVALLPTARGLGVGSSALLLLRADAARQGLHRLRLIAVGEARRFWMAAGFTATTDALPDCYGRGATAMQKLTG